jgi:hypothetical protein
MRSWTPTISDCGISGSGRCARPRSAGRPPVARAPDLGGVLEALGRDQTQPRAAPLDQRVGADSGGIDDAVRRPQRLFDLETGLVGSDARRVEEADLEIVMRRVRLAAEQRAVADAHHVGEGTADIDAETHTHRPSPGRRRNEVMLALQRLDVDLHVPRQRMAGRQVLGFHQGGAFGTVEFDEHDPVGIEREVEFLARTERKMDLPRISRPDGASLLVGFMRRAETVAAAIADPPLARETMARYSVIWISMGSSAPGTRRDRPRDRRSER